MILPLLLFVAMPATIPLVATPVTLDPADPARRAVGKLRWRGGVALTSPDVRLGGLSSLRWREGRLVAASDSGDFFAFAPVERAGRLVGVGPARVIRLDGRDGRPLPAAKDRGDFEALEVSPGHVTLAMEGESTILRYRLVRGMPAGAPTEVPDAADWRARQWRTNGGIEAMAFAPGLRLMLSEELREADGGASGHLTVGAVQQIVSLPLADDFKPTDLVILDAARRRFLVLERRYHNGEQNWTRLARFRVVLESGRWRIADVETLATLRAPLTIDNMEGLALRRLDDRTFVYMVSDDNFSKTQRTLLMKWEVAD